MQESEGDSDDMWDRSSESESSSSDEEVRPLGTLTADFFRKKYARSPSPHFIVNPPTPTVAILMLLSQCPMNRRTKRTEQNVYSAR